MTTTAIEILDPGNLGRYTHASTPQDAEHLRDTIAKLEASGHVVTAATSRRSSVPNSYRDAWKVKAPVWRFDAERRTIGLADDRLQKRALGRTIPAHVVVRGIVPTPEGFGCVRRTEENTTLTCY